MAHQVTIKDLARHLNVSVATISRALRDMPEIKPETRQAVLQLAKEWDYQPNILATSLVKSRTKTIGVIVPDLAYHFFASVIKGIEEEAFARGYSLLLTQTSELYERELINVQNLSRGQVEGFVVSLSQETVDLDHLKRLQRKGIPLVFFDRDAEELDVSKVMVDNVGAAYEATKHLIDNGCKRIAFLAGPQSVTVSNQRLEGYGNALKDHGILIEESLIVHGEYALSKAVEITHHLLNLENRPDGLIVVSDRLAVGAISALKARNIKIPEEVAVVSFNDEPICTVITPTLSSVAQPTLDIGRNATALLINEIEDTAGTFKPEIQILKTQLIVRESSQRLK
ncbi:LacI family DNA-binding transcriptional regulator [Arcicella rosea]|uniref:DNA-binding LacI/PurR family transcriptional regulator n=1 Tax=Arcicella rosea TaxID=502909 RepID=A0A841ETE3_9BACT|nr:LacI family DNA-binding transcriptional regulator [Arcicella rosea]MBB6004669.1 DNA-binding LacI/PurR family transcriptional regulator [Arcicella rosea]